MSEVKQGDPTVEASPLRTADQYMAQINEHNKKNGLPETTLEEEIADTRQWLRQERRAAQSARSSQLDILNIKMDRAAVHLQALNDNLDPTQFQAVSEISTSQAEVLPPEKPGEKRYVVAKSWPKPNEETKMAVYSNLPKPS